MYQVDDRRSANTEAASTENDYLFILVLEPYHGGNWWKCELSQTLTTKTATVREKISFIVHS